MKGAMTPSMHELEERLRGAAPAGVFDPDAVVGPEPVVRYLRTAISPDTPLAPAVRLAMRGSIKIGRWLPFRAKQLLAPRLGTVWEARVAGVISGSDRYVGGIGGMDWRLLGRLRLVHVEGDDVSRSAAERAAGESIWAPTAVVPATGVEWSADTADHIRLRFDVDGHVVTLEHDIDADGHLRSSQFQRWGDPDNTGSWDLHPFGVEVTSTRTFGGATLPASGRAGWHYGTDRWTDGVFFRFEITGYDLVVPRK